MPPRPLDQPPLLERLRGSLSAKLLLLTIAFVLLAEFVLLVPSVARQRVAWLNARIEAAYLVSLALEAPEAEMIKPAAAKKLFATANILGVMIDRDGANHQVLAPDIDFAAPPKMKFIDLRMANPPVMAGDAWATVFSRGDDMVRVIGNPTYAPAETVDMIVSQRALRRDLLVYARNILLLSLFISSVTAALVYWALNRMIVVPVARLTKSMTDFEANPEARASLIRPSDRADEIGVAERSLGALERSIQSLLSQRRRLAALGAGVSKITHDLRNILASAQLMSDRLAASDDPRVQKLSPRLIAALDRAIALSRDTLSFARMEPQALSKSRFALAALIDEAFEDAAAMHAVFANEIDPSLHVVADRNHLYRALSNLIRNAVEAVAPETDDASAETAARAATGRIVARARAQSGAVVIEIADDGPGVPEAARETLFEPFRGSTRPGGSGLGVAIAHEIARAHGGDLTLARNGPDGATFALTLPDEERDGAAAGPPPLEKGG